MIDVKKYAVRIAFGKKALCIMTAATSKEQAVKIVLSAENAPESAILSVREVKNA